MRVVVWNNMDAFITWADNDPIFTNFDVVAIVAGGQSGRINFRSARSTCSSPLPEQTWLHFGTQFEFPIGCEKMMAICLE